MQSHCGRLWLAPHDTCPKDRKGAFTGWVQCRSEAAASVPDLDSVSDSWPSRSLYWLSYHQLWLDGFEDEGLWGSHPYTVGKGVGRARTLATLVGDPSLSFFKILFFFLDFFFFFGCAGSQLQDLYLRHVGSSSLTSDWTQVPCTGSAES